MSSITNEPKLEELFSIIDRLTFELGHDKHYPITEENGSYTRDCGLCIALTELNDWKRQSSWMVKSSAATFDYYPPGEPSS